jgi:predicted ATPase
MNLDLRQIEIADKLKFLAQKLEENSAQNFLQKLISNKYHQKSFYIYGDVGRGKTMLMKSFYDSLHKTPKIYFHFNAFMQKIHETLRDIRSEKKDVKDELILAVSRVIDDKKIICFDEFQVVDIADAMLLSRIFSFIFEQGIVVIFTSNSNPKDLYKNGLQREVFLEFVDKILRKNCEILYLDSQTDYRRRYRESLTKRYFINNQKNREEIKNIIEAFGDGEPHKSKKIMVWGRELKIKKTYGKIAILTFDELCKNPLSAADYRAICQNFDLIFLLKLPSLTNEDINEARRLTLFIDEIYENKTALIILAKTGVEKIFLNATNAEGSKRTLSRLNEIKSDHYWQTSKISINK